MSFELLPNEILLDLFDYFDSTDLFFTFHGLNSRFNYLIYNQNQFYRFNFKWVSKRNFDRICQQHIPGIADRVIALQLSDHKYTPNQITLFFSYIPSFKHFTRLQFLSVDNVDSNQLLMKIINECHHLSYLTRLKLHSDPPQDGQIDIQLLVHNIWTLTKLIHCSIDINVSDPKLFHMPTEISPFLECVRFERSQFKWNQINQLFKYTPCLTCLSIRIALFDHDAFSPSFFPTLTDLKITTYSNQSGIEKMFAFLQNTPNLYRLDVRLSVLVDGNRWEQMIRNYLPKLKIFRLNMYRIIRDEQNIQKRVDELVDSFRGSFWIDEHQWFIRCHAEEKRIYCSTLHKNNSDFCDMLFDSFKSTCPLNNEQEYYNNMNHITNNAFFNQTISSHIQLHNIEVLYIELPLNDQFWSRVSSLNRLSSLVVWRHVDMFQSQLQALFNRAPHLVALTIYQNVSSPLQRSLFEYTNISVRHLYLQYNNLYFNEEECIALARSPLGAQCEVLFIGVKNRESIIHLVTQMIKLRSLDVGCDDNDEIPDTTTSTKDELIQWLKDRLPSTCCIERHLPRSKNIQIWI
jgi:hypothetical protein